VKPGRELDALVAEKVMGLVRCKADCGIQWCFAKPESSNKGGELRSYSERIEDAWEVVERIKSRRDYVGWSLVCDDLWSPGYRAGFCIGRGVEYSQLRESAPLAICEAALAVMEGIEG
jgi:hypothetical protein